MTGPVREEDRIETLDVLRGFALLGILLLNIIGFGLHSAAYSNPGFDLAGTTGANVTTWAAVELMAEGAMRCLFSMLFGAGVLLIATGGRQKSGGVYYRRTFLLLLFGLFDSYILLWNGDILVTYALAGALLYFVRNSAARRLFIMAGVLLVAISSFYVAMSWSLGLAQEAALQVEASQDPEALPAGVKIAAEQYHEFFDPYFPSDAEVAHEYEVRRASYFSAFKWNVKKSNEMHFFVIPVIMLWDALAMMLLGMAFYKSGVLQGERSPGFYLLMTGTGFAVGLLTNSYEISRALASDFEIFSTFAQMQPTYHIGRLGMACGYMGLIAFAVRLGARFPLRKSLAAVGRMALTNYLMHSMICLFIFTGAGLALVGKLERAELYPVVFGIWAVQLGLSPWWLKRYHYGPLEWLWRWLTYGKRPRFIRA